MPSTYKITFGPTLTAPAPLKNGATLTLDGSTAQLEGTDRDTSKQVMYTGQLAVSNDARIASFTSRNGTFLSTPLIFESFPISVTAGKVMVGAFYESTDRSAPAIPADDVGSYVAVEPDTDPDTRG